MRLRTTLRWIVITLAACLLTACQNTTVSGLFRPTDTPVPPTATATLTSTPTETPTPTITPTPEPTFTPTPAVMTIEAGSVTAPILLYHHISTDADKQGSRYNIDPLKFEEQVKWLYDNGYRTITVTDLANLIWQGGVVPLRPVVITFDDGNLDVYNYGYPILKKYGFAATFYVVENYIDKKDMISADQLKELIQNGWEIGSHSMSHAHLTDKSTDLGEEIHNSKVEMEQWLGVPINSFAYPYGEMSPDIVTLVSRYGYTSASGLGSSYVNGLNSIYYLWRIEVQNDYSMEKFISLLPWSGPLQ